MKLMIILIINLILLFTAMAINLYFWMFGGTDLQVTLALLTMIIMAISSIGLFAAFLQKNT